MKIIHIAAVRFNSENKHIKGGGLSHSVPKLAMAQSEKNSLGIITTRGSSKPNIGNIYWKSISNKSFFDLLLNDPFNELKREFGIPDIIHTHDIYELKSLAFIFHAKKHDIKVFISPRGNLSDVALSRKKLKKMIYLYFCFNLFLSKINGFVALNDGEKKIIKNRYKKKNVIIIGNGVDNNGHYYNKYRRNYIEKNQSSEINIGYIGRLEIHIKGIDLLIRSFINFKKMFRDKRAKLTLIGAHSEKTNSINFFRNIENEIKDKSLIDFKGPLFNDDKFSEISKFDIFVHPSRTEGMPNAVLEAMSMGIPCMVSPQTNMGPIINAADCGWVVENDEESLSNFFAEIINIDKKVLQKKGNNGMDYSRKYLSWEMIGETPYK